MSLFFAGGWRLPLYQPIAVATNDAVQGRIQGEPGGRAPLFLTKSILFFYSVYNVWKNILEIKFW